MKLTPAKVTMLMLVAVGGLIGLYVIKGLFAVEKKIERPRTVTIPLATAMLTPGTKISDTHIGMGPFPASELKEDTLRSARVTVNRVVKGTIKPGSPIRGSDLYEPGENAPLQIAEGKQAVSVTVKNSSEMVDGLIKPGEYVDVHFVLDPSNAGGLDDRLVKLGGVSMTLFKGIKVLALNKGFRQSPLLPAGNSVTLEMAPEQTNVILVAQPRGSISLTSNPTGEGDGGVALDNADRATLWEILGLKKRTRAPEPKPEEPEKPFVTESYRGLGSGSMQWDKDGRRWEARTGSAVGYGGGRRFVDWPSGSGGGNDRGPGGGTYWGSPSPSDPYDYTRGGYSSGGGNLDDFDPDDVFVNPGSRSSDVPSQGAAAPSADPDIPMSQPGSAGGGVRSRVGSMLRARPKSTDSTAGPTALRN